jgi:hypothetical protein
MTIVVHQRSLEETRTAKSGRRFTILPGSLRGNRDQASAYGCCGETLASNGLKSQLALPQNRG